jgi:hypothetical protein
MNASATENTINGTGEHGAFLRFADTFLLIFITFSDIFVTATYESEAGNA